MNNPRITKREWEVAELVAFGLTEKEIANHLEISINTIKRYKRDLSIKVGCRNIADITRWYIQKVSGFRLEPKETIKKLISILFLVMVLIAEYSSSEFMRARVRARRITTRETTSRTRVRHKNTLYLKVA